jgi:hypothetical protein
MKRNFGMRYIILLAFSALWARSPQDTLKFSHTKHVQDAGVECLDCHAANAEKSSVAAPGHEVCNKCHEEAMTGKNCALCHSNPTEAKSSGFPHRHRSFSHPAHLKQNMKCETCHPGVGKTEKVTAKNMPSMDACMTCHNDKTAPSRCGLCHDDLDKIKPSSHTHLNFAGRVHGRDAKFGRSECNTCHAQSFCDRCHQGRDKRAIHRPDFRFTHGREAGKGDMNCAYCHESKRFCVACHEGRK